MTHDFLNDLQVGFVLAEASAECVPQDMAAKLWQKNRVTIFFLRLGFFFLIIVCTNRADSAVDGIGEINLSITSAENKAGVPINFIGAETNDLLILVFFQKGIEHFINHWNNADASFRFGRVYMVGASAIFLHTINKIVVDAERLLSEAEKTETYRGLSKIDILHTVSIPQLARTIPLKGLNLSLEKYRMPDGVIIEVESSSHYLGSFSEKNDSSTNWIEKIMEGVGIH